ncbi:MAG: class aminotransferase [Gammaproteobacteria bacterium]|nr:class aminotransferase [Gammaproteobacteria bacterium]
MTAQNAIDDGSGYFLYHSIGLFPDKARLIAEALNRFAAIWGTANDSQWPQSLGLRAQFIDRWQAKINAPAGSVTTAENVTTALYSFIGSLPDRYLKGKRLLIAADCFPSLHFLLSGMAVHRGFVLDTVRARPGESWVRDEDFLARWDAGVGVALLTFVTSTTSHRCDLEGLVRHARQTGSVVGVDITQGVGILPFDAQAPEVDFTVSTTLKWLCGTAGAGILHVRPELLVECRPELRGWFSQENILAWNIDAFQYAGDARRFDHGTPSVIACAASLPALDWHASQDPGKLLAHNRELTSAILRDAPRLGLELVSPRAESERGGSLMLKIPAHANPAELVDRLRSEQLYTDCRGTTLRLSPGCLTTSGGVERLLAALGRIL